MKFSPQQENALGVVADWFHNGGWKDNQVCRVFGFAGTGKTTIAKHLIEGIDGTVLAAAFTGKAALVMRRSGLKNASTIHKLVYRLVPMNEVKMRELKKEKNACDDPAKTKKIMQQMRELAQPKFEVNPESEIRHASLILLDECSMVNGEMRDDLLSFGKPVLVLGDPGQLPPIRGTGAFNTPSPEVMLTEIHRQALDNPIIKLATMARTGEKIPLGNYGESSKISPFDFKLSNAKKADQILCGKNATRLNLNKKWRYYSGFDNIFPMKGEKIICLKNGTIEIPKSKTVEPPPPIPIFNGQQMTVVDADYDESDYYTPLTIKDDEDREFLIRAFNAYFNEYSNPGGLKNFTQYDMKGFEQFDFGYAITCHKSQGSQWPNVLVYDDKIFISDPEMRMQWLYTALTRAEQSVTIVDA